MALTLLEAAKKNPANELSSAVVELYTGSSDILLNLGFQGIQGNALTYNREAKLPNVGFRGVNESFSESTGILNPITESLVIAGGDLDVDTFIVETMGAEQRSVQEAMQVRALSWEWTAKFIKGDQVAEPRELSGLQARVVGDQLISAGSTANGEPLSLSILDDAIDQTLNPTHFIMNKKMRRRLAQASRDQAVGGLINYEQDQMGRNQMFYDGIPILIVDLDGEGDPILGFDEAADSGTATATSIYIVNFADEGVTGIQNGSIRVRDLGELDDDPTFRTRVEWYSGLAIFNGRAATRLNHIADAPIVA